jgi:hypothetical protein
MTSPVLNWCEALTTDHGMIMLVLVRMLYLTATRIFAWLVLLARSSAYGVPKLITGEVICGFGDPERA